MPSRKLIISSATKAEMEAAAKAAAYEARRNAITHKDGRSGTSKSGKKSNSSVRRALRGSAASAPQMDYMKLILNPCHGPLVRSVGTVVPGAIIERVRSTVTVDTSTNTSGYIVFFPSYHGSTVSPTGYAPSSVYLYTTADTTVRPTNTAALPLGMGAATSAQGRFLTDPIRDQIGSSSTFTRAQTLAACVQLDCITALSTIAGQVAVVSNYSLANFNQGTGGNSFIAPSVDEVFNYAAVRERLNLEGHEVRWRPSDHAAVPRTNGREDSDTAASGPKADAVLWQGLASGLGEATREVSIDPASTRAICIAWRGVPASTSGLVLNLVKVCSLELAGRNNAIEQIPTGSTAESVATTIDSVVNYMDRVFRGGWQIGKGMYDFSMGALRLSNAAHGAMKLVENNYAPMLRARAMRSLTNG